jgi:thiol-disulfide isomerase/thioredoxin
MKKMFFTTAIVAAAIGITVAIYSTKHAGASEPPLVTQQEAQKVDGEKEGGDAPAPDSEIQSAKNAFADLAKLIKKKDYEKASQFMTKAYFDTFCAQRILGAQVTAHHQYGSQEMAKKVKGILDMYNIESVDMSDLPAPSGGQIQIRRDYKKLLKNFKSLEQRSAALRELDEATKPGSNSRSMSYKMEPFDAEVVNAKFEGQQIVLEAKINMPGGMMMIGGSNGQMPPGSAVTDADKLGELPASAQRGIETDKKPEVTTKKRMIVRGLPPMFFRLVKEDSAWKLDRMDMGEMPASPKGGKIRRDIPTIENPEFEGKTLAGDEVSLKGYRGKLVLVDCWGTWCGPCVAEFPKLEKLYNLLKGHDFEIVGIAKDNEEDLEQFMKLKELPWKNIVDNNGEICDKLGIIVFPTTLLIDKDGNHVASNLKGNELLEELSERLKLEDEEMQALKKILRVE